MFVNRLRVNDELFSTSWDTNTHIWIRNFPFEVSPYTHLRKLAGQKKALRVLDIGRAIPYKALSLADPERFRTHGDYLVYAKDGGAHAAPSIESYFLSDNDYLPEFIMNARSDNYGIQLDQLGYLLGYNQVATTVDQRRRLLDRYEERQVARAINPIISDNWIEALEELKSSRTTFDLIFVDLTEVSNRMQLLHAVQQVLSSDGKAFIPFGWWRLTSNEGIVSFPLIEDTVNTEQEVTSLGKFLGDQSGMTYVHGVGVELLAIERNAEIPSLSMLNRQNVERDLIQKSPEIISWSV